MVNQLRKKRSPALSRPGAFAYTYEDTEQMIWRCAGRLALRWSNDCERMKDKERYLRKKLLQLAGYLETASNDAYLMNLFFQYHGARQSKKPLSKGIAAMEKKRKSFVRALKSSVRPEEITQHVFNAKHKTKWKFLIRLIAAQHTAQALYEKLIRMKSKPTNPPPLLFNLHPGITAENIKKLFPAR